MQIHPNYREDDEEDKELLPAQADYHSLVLVDISTDSKELLGSTVRV